MKIAVLSDIHGNLSALRAVLNDVRMNRAEHIILACFQIDFRSEWKERSK
jgi:predicted phosphodiesterase